MAMNPRAYVADLATRATHSSRPAVRDGYRLARQVLRDSFSLVSKRQFGLVAQVQTARWTGPTTYEITGWTYERGYGHPDGPPELQIWLQAESRRIEASVEHTVDTDVNAAARKAEFDYANTAFRARFELAELFDSAADPPGGHPGWQLLLRVAGAGRDRTGFFKSYNRFGAARHLFAHTDRDIQVVPEWVPRRGLVFFARRPTVMATEVAVDGRRFSTVVHTRGPELTGAGLQTGEEVTRLSCEPLPAAAEGTRRFRLSGEVAADYVADLNALPQTADAALRVVLVHDAAGQVFPVGFGLDDRDPVITPEATLIAAAGSTGILTLVDAPARLMVDDFTVHLGGSGEVQVRGRLIGTWTTPNDAGGALPPVTLDFLGPRQLLPVETTFQTDGSFTATVTLRIAEWGGEALPPRSGGYVLRAIDPAGQSLPVTCLPGVLRRTPEVHSSSRFRLRMQGGGERRLRFRISPPRRDDELGSYHQGRLERRYREGEFEPQESVYFESFYGRSSTCNPRAIDGALAAGHPELVRYWGVVDTAVSVPEGAVKVVRGTKEFWRARTTSRYVVANDWLRRTFQPHPYQVVLQTWHGSMLKRLALDRSGQPRRKLREIYTERAKWGYLLAQNRHSSEIFRSAYAWDGPVWEEGYPRNDPMSTASGEAIRTALGIRPDQVAVLYAPTWRENQTEMVTFLDVERLTAELGDEYVVLIRGHSRTVEHGQSVQIPGSIDVTTYPEVTDLFLAADALITDYSSVMFDYSITGRPMIFFVPDMDDYRDSLRGVYFDLSEVAPGPVLATQDEVVTAIRELDQAGERYAERYAAWQQRFNHHDDGHAAERIVELLLHAAPAGAVESRREDRIPSGWSWRDSGRDVIERLGVDRDGRNQVDGDGRQPDPDGSERPVDQEDRPDDREGAEQS